MIKAMFFDLDGTLLNSAKRAPDPALRALRRCRESASGCCRHGLLLAKLSD